jgi:hypothetical protein
MTKSVVFQLPCVQVICGSLQYFISFFHYNNYLKQRYLLEAHFVLTSFISSILTALLEERLVRRVREQGIGATGGSTVVSGQPLLVTGAIFHF